jgi:hypothetical protein
LLGLLVPFQFSQLEGVRVLRYSTLVGDTTVIHIAPIPSAASNRPTVRTLESFWMAFGMDMLPTVRVPEVGGRKRKREASDMPRGTSVSRNGFWVHVLSYRSSIRYSDEGKKPANQSKLNQSNN